MFEEISSGISKKCRVESKCCAFQVERPVSGCGKSRIAICRPIVDSATRPPSRTSIYMSNPPPGKQSKKSRLLRPFKGLFSRSRSLSLIKITQSFPYLPRQRTVLYFPKGFSQQPPITLSLPCLPRQRIVLHLDPRSAHKAPNIRQSLSFPPIPALLHGNIE